MTTAAAERTADAIERGLIKEWPWRYYLAESGDQIIRKLQVDSDLDLIESIDDLADYPGGYTLRQVSKEEYEKAPEPSEEVQKIMDAMWEGTLKDMGLV